MRKNFQAGLQRIIRFDQLEFRLAASEERREQAPEMPVDDAEGGAYAVAGKTYGELLVWIGERADDRSSAVREAPVYPDTLRALHRRRAEGFGG